MSSVSDRLRRNNFDLLRLLFAGMVAVVHVATLSAEPALAWVPRVISSALAVKAFFVVSGFLIVMSFERSPTWQAYFEKRARRIYPAYAVVVLLAAVLLPLITAQSDAIFAAAWWQYVVWNLLFLNFLQPTLPGVFVGNPIPFVNGALWTLKVEVGFYLLVPVIVWLCRRYNWLSVLTLLYASSVAYVPAAEALAARGLVPGAMPHQLPGQLSYFLAGAAVYRFRSGFERQAATLVGVALVVLAADQWWALRWVEPAALATVVIGAGLFAYLGRASRFGDFSYGLYILHFPVIQAVVFLGIAQGRPWTLLAFSLALSGIGSVVLWHGVEKRWLLPSSHYLTANRHAG